MPTDEQKNIIRNLRSNHLENVAANRFKILDIFKVYLSEYDSLTLAPVQETSLLKQSLTYADQIRLTMVELEKQLVALLGA